MVFSFKRTLASSSAPAECLNRVVLMCFNSPLAALLIIRRLLVQRMPIAKWKGDELPFPRFMDTLSVTFPCDTKTWFPGLGVAFDPDRRMFHQMYEIADVLYRFISLWISVKKWNPSGELFCLLNIVTSVILSIFCMLLHITCYLCIFSSSNFL